MKEAMNFSAKLISLALSFLRGSLAVLARVFKILDFKFFSFIDSREREREGERGAENCQCEREVSIGCFLHVSDSGPNPPPRHMP